MEVMNKKAYELANNINMEAEIGTCGHTKPLSPAEIKHYRKTFRKRTGKHAKKAYPKYAAACLAALFLSAAVVSGDAHAAIEHIRWSISSALGLPGSLEKYREVIDTSVTDNGYVFTLQEVVATEDKLVINYTVAREDGLSLGEIPCVPDATLYINGIAIRNGSSGGSTFLDDANTILGVDMSYETSDIDMSRENTYQIRFRSLGNETNVRGKWDFEFTADAAELLADTRRIPIGKEFLIADGITVTLEELSLNELEQRISYSIKGTSNQILMLMAEDTDGRQVEFDTKIYDGNTGEGYMQNQEILYDVRISETADTVSLTLYSMELPEESGKMSNDYRQIGETFALKIN